ncbi:MAG: hypothetical protein JSR18_05295 [Proteobacteria bacterium]|nr:hypothetical protein [Pseudomonadota bacterium]
MVIPKVVVVCAAALYALCSNAFEVDTHARMTAASWSTFIEKRPQVVEEIGIVRGKVLTDPKFHQYYDASADVIRARYFYVWELGKIYGVDSREMPTITAILGTPAEWLMQGVVREDDSQGESNPQDNPFIATANNERYRVLNHFLDPVNRKPLQFLDDRGVRADDWAIGRIPGKGDNAPDLTRSNHFSVFDARESMYRALTGNAGSGNEVAMTELERNRWWATTFRALGDVLHLIQDMAQPQHTRNDTHSGRLCPGDPDPMPRIPCTGGHKSVLEQYMNNRARGVPATTHIVCTNDTSPADYIGIAQPLEYLGYPIPSRDSYGSFFFTETLSGLADYSNRGFFSAGTNIGATTYALPITAVSAYTRVLQAYPLPCARHLSARVALLVGNVADAGVGVATNIPLSAEGMFSAASTYPAYTLVRANYDAMAALLIPRAVAYSAGLLDYFFRGTLAITAPAVGVFAVADHSSSTGFTKLKLKVRNTNARSEAMTKGTAVAVIRFRNNTCYTSDLHGQYGSPDVAAPFDCRDDKEQVATSEPQPLSLASGEERQLEFDLSNHPLPFSASDIYVQVVYRGQLGKENDAIAVGTVDLPEPLFFALMNITDSLCVNGQFVAFDGSGEKLVSSSATNYLISRHEADKTGVVATTLRPAPYESIEVRFAEPDDPDSTVARIAALPEQRYSRIALLTDHFDNADATFLIDNTCGPDAHCPNQYGGSYRGPTNQANYKTGTFTYTKIDPWRGAYADGYMGVYKYVGKDCGDVLEAFSWPALTNLDPVHVDIAF